MRAWRAAERSRRALLRDHPDVRRLIAAVAEAEAQRDANWQQVLQLQADVRHLATGLNAAPVAEDTSVLRLRQQVEDLAAIVGRLIGAGWDDPIFAAVAARSQQAVVDGRLLERSVLDALDVTQPMARAIPPPPAVAPSPEPPQLSRAERRRREREVRRNRS